MWNRVTLRNQRIWLVDTRIVDKNFATMTEAELKALDALLAHREISWWNGFYEQRSKPCPFFVESPDESLAEWITEGILPHGRALDLGCGNARNAIHLAKDGWIVDAVDYAASAIAWARERVAVADVGVQLHCRSVFELNFDPGSYDFVYDSGCFHHIAPHRRHQYVTLVAEVLRPGGYLGLTCFRPEGGSGLTDEEVYERGTLGGGLGYTEARLRETWSTCFAIRGIRQMTKMSHESGLFGEDYLWVMLAQRR
jgi:SAM-dependent methyltransferase